MADYLWDKSGADADVEALEASLGGLRYEGAPPELPVREAQVRPLPRADRAPRAAFKPSFGMRGKTPLAIAVSLGLIAGVVSYSAIKKKESDVRRGWNLVPVVVAGEDIPEGTVVTFDMVSQRAVPEQFITSSVVKPDSASYVVNQKVLVPLQKGDPLMWSQFETTKAAERLSSKIQKKARAVTLEVAGKASVGGWVRPNDHVDVIATMRDPDTNENVALTLMQNVIVLATGKITGTTNVNLIPEAQREYGNVSLMVIPEEAEMLVLASELGSLTLALRNEDDVDAFEERGRATIKTLLSGERTRVLQERRNQVIQVIRGSGKNTDPR